MGDDEAERLAESIVLALRRMDAEADGLLPPQEPGAPPVRPGLLRYHDHYNRIHQMELDCEAAWTRDLARILREQGRSARPEGGGVLVDAGPERGGLWVRLRGAWSVGFRIAGEALEPYAREDAAEALARVARELAEAVREAPRAAREAAVVLIAFDAPLRPLDEELGELAKGASGWRVRASSEWPEPHWGTRALVRVLSRSLPDRSRD